MLVLRSLERFGPVCRHHTSHYTPHSDQWVQSSPLSFWLVSYVLGCSKCTRGINAREEAPVNTDLDEGTKCGPGAQSTVDSTAWACASLTAFLALIADVSVNLAAAARYSLSARKPSHVVVFDPDGFHLWSCSKCLRHGPLCRLYLTVILRFIGGKYEGFLLGHDFDSSSVHIRWRKSTDGNGEPLTVSRVLEHTGHGDGWDGRRRQLLGPNVGRPEQRGRRSPLGLCGTDR